jgi:hypothetical protein
MHAWGESAGAAGKVPEDLALLLRNCAPLLRSFA